MADILFEQLDYLIQFADQEHGRLDRVTAVLMKPLSNKAVMLTATLDAPSLGDCALRREVTNASARTDDINLARRIRTGDQSAFRELVERHQSKIFRVLRGILNHRDDAEDVAQDVFAKVYFSIRQFDHRSTLLTWIYRIAVNEAYSHLRKKRAMRRDGNDLPLDAAGLHSLIDALPTPDRAVAQRDFVNKLLALIPEEDRLLLFCEEVEGCSVAEVAEMTGMNENTIKVRLFRVRQRLVELAGRLSRGPARRPVAFDQDKV